MTNKQYHRKVRALARTKSRRDTLALNLEVAALHRLTRGYRLGLHRAKNGRGATRHHSNAAA